MADRFMVTNVSSDAELISAYRQLGVPVTPGLTKSVKARVEIVKEIMEKGFHRPDTG